MERDRGGRQVWVVGSVMQCSSSTGTVAPHLLPIDQQFIASGHRMIQDDDAQKTGAQPARKSPTLDAGSPSMAWNSPRNSPLMCCRRSYCGHGAGEEVRSIRDRYVHPACAVPRGAYDQHAVSGTNAHGRRTIMRAPNTRAAVHMSSHRKLNTWRGGGGRKRRRVREKEERERSEEG